MQSYFLNEEFYPGGVMERNFSDFGEINWDIFCSFTLYKSDKNRKCLLLDGCMYSFLNIIEYYTIGIIEGSKLFQCIN